MATELTEIIIAKFRDAASTAVSKERVEDLTEDERAALLVFGGAPYEFDPITGRMRVGPHALVRSNGKWLIVHPRR